MSELEIAAAVESEETARGSKEDAEDQLAEAGAHTSRSTASQIGGTSIGGAPSCISQSHFEDQYNVDDVKKAITFSNSITDAVNDVVVPLRDINIIAVHKDNDQSILNKAVHRIKENFTENRALSEVAKMYDLYKSSLVDNSLLEAQCHELQEKVKQYEARHLWDPRVLRVLLIAERYRQEKAMVYDEKNEIEAELIDSTIEMKHLEDVIKNKNKDFQKCQDELKKAKELEKQVEQLEIQLMKKDNKIQSLQENMELLILSHRKAETQHAIPTLGLLSEDAKPCLMEREMQLKIDHVCSEKATLKNEVDEKTNLLYALHKKMAQIKVDNAELQNQCQEHLKTIGKKGSENLRLINNFSHVEQRMAVLRDQLTVAKSENVSLRKALEGCSQGNADVTHLLEKKTTEGVAQHLKLSSALKRLVDCRQTFKTCAGNLNAMQQENKIMEEDFKKGQKQLSDKKSECEKLVFRLYKLDALKKRYLDLLRLARLNSRQMAKEISELRHDLVQEKGHLSKTEGVMTRMQGQIEALQREYIDVLEKNVLLVRNYEMTSSAIEQYEQLKVVHDRRLAHLMKTNIDLYTQTTSQQEIALIQSHQFQLKENEIKGLLSRLEEEDHKMERMVLKDKEKRNIIDQLHSEANSREIKIKSLKSTIESSSQLNKSLNDKTEELSYQLRQVTTQSELVRRQRDLFGAKILQSQAETQLCLEGMRTASDTMTKYSVDFYNMENDIRVLKLEIKNLRRKSKLSEGHLELIYTLRQELGQACKALELQKCKNTILENTKMPLVHRWRSLQASDPSKYEMVMKNQCLIRRLMTKSKEVASLEELLKQKDTMYLSLRVLVQRRMDSQLSSEMMSAKHVIQKQHRQLQALTAELNMANDDTSRAEYKEQQNKKKLDDMVADQAREKVARLRKYSNKKEMSRIPLLPSLPEISKEKARQ